VDYLVYSTGKVFASKEWMVGRTPDGRVTNTIRNNANDLISSYNAQEYQRGDQFDFSIAPGISIKNSLKEGEVVGYLYSNAMQQQLATLEGQLNVEKANLEVVSTGQKEEVIAQMKKNVDLAKEKYKLQKKLFTRTEALFKDSLIAQQEYDMARNALDMAELTVQLNETQLLNATTGDKPEAITYANERIHSLEIQINALKTRLSKFEVKAPFSGLIQHKKGAYDLNFEIILNLLDTSSLIVFTPIPVKEVPFLMVGQEIKYILFNSSETLTGKLVAIDNAIQVVGGRQVIYITTEINKSDLALMPGLFVQTEVNCGEISLWDYIGRTFGSIIFK
jgi:multidrug efflux pump subunit AcrA (membrane-fusion protein)